MKAIIDTQILYYTLKDYKNPPIDRGLFLKEIQKYEVRSIPDMNLAEFVHSDTLTSKEKEEGITILLENDFCIGYQTLEVSKSVLLDIRKKIGADHPSLSFILTKKKEFEHLVLIELAESLVGIFAIFLNYEDPLSPGKQSQLFNAQFEALLKGNQHFTDSELYSHLNTHYSSKKRKDAEFNKAFLEYIIMLLYILVMNFYSSKCEMILSDFFALPKDDSKKLMIDYYINRSSFFAQIKKIMNDEVDGTKILSGKNKTNIRKAIEDYKSMLRADNYPEAYIENVALIFDGIFLQGQKIFKNDVIDNNLFTYPSEYTIITMETRILTRLEKIDPSRYSKTKAFIDTIKR